MPAKEVRSKLIRTATLSYSLYVLLPGQLKYLNRYFDTIAISGEGEFLKKVRHREGVRAIAISMQRKISPIKDVIALWRLYRCFKREKPKIVHSITPKAGLLSMTAAYMSGVPIRMHTFTGLIFPSKRGFLRKLLIQMDRLLCKFATNIYPEGQGVKSDLVKYRITNKPLTVIANGNINGIDLTYFQPNQFHSQKMVTREKLFISISDFVYVFVGRLVSDKGINELVSAFCKLYEQNVGIKLILVGSQEPELDPLDSETIETINSHPAIITTGYEMDVRPYFEAADALVFPSYREGFPNVVLQAGAMGLPSIVTDINGCNEIIENGKNGLIIPPKDSCALKEAMQLLIDDQELRRKLKENSRAIIASKYDQKIVWEALLAEYEKLDKNVQISSEIDI